MSRIIKWEFKKAYHTLKVIVLVYAVFLAVFNLVPFSFFSAILGGSFDFSAAALMSLAVWLGTLYFYLFFPIHSMVTSFRPAEYYLEKPRQITYAMVFLAKTLVNIASLIIGSVITFIGMSSIFSLDVTLVEVPLSPSFLLIIYACAVLFPVIAAFIAVLPPMFGMLPNHRWIWRTILALIFFFLFTSIDTLSLWLQVVICIIALIVFGGLAVYLADRRYET